jgi:hypothetical protein
MYHVLDGKWNSFFLVEGLLHLAFSFRFSYKNLSQNGDKTSNLGFKEKKKKKLFISHKKNLYYVLPEYAIVSYRQYSCKMSNAFGPNSPLTLFFTESLRLSYLFYLSWLVAQRLMRAFVRYVDLQCHSRKICLYILCTVDANRFMILWKRTSWAKKCV